MRGYIVKGTLLASLACVAVLLALLVPKDRLAADSGDFEAEFDEAYTVDVTKSGRIVDYTLVASGDHAIEIFEGHRTRVWSYNKQVPGPILRITHGDTIRVKFVNKLPQPTSVHWHGIRIPQAMDGFPGVSQDAVAPGESFTYEFTPKDAGTFWFHPHVRGSEQLERGLYGVLIVEDEISARYDRDIVWVVDDWLLTENAQVYASFVTMPEVMHDGRWGNVATVNGSLRPLLQLTKGERIRLRVVNTSNARVYTLNFGGLPATVIAVDGMYVREVFDPSKFALAPGNRLDIDIHAGDEDASYRVTDSFPHEAYELARVEIAGDAGFLGAEAREARSFAHPVNERVPSWKTAYRHKVDQRYTLDNSMGGSMMGGGMMSMEWTLNGYAYPEYEEVRLEAGRFATIALVNKSSSLHPMHLHSQFFKLIARNGRSVEEAYFRDTVLIEPNETVVVAMIPFNKGLWPLHCHIQEHSDVGMLTLVEVF